MNAMIISKKKILVISGILFFLQTGFADDTDVNNAYYCPQPNSAPSHWDCTPTEGSNYVHKWSIGSGIAHTYKAFCSTASDPQGAPGGQAGIYFPDAYTIRCSSSKDLNADNFKDYAGTHILNTYTNANNTEHVYIDEVNGCRIDEETPGNVVVTVKDCQNENGTYLVSTNSGAATYTKCGSGACVLDLQNENS